MKISTSLLLLGAATSISALPDQIPLQNSPGTAAHGSFDKDNRLEEVMKKLHESTDALVDTFDEFVEMLSDLYPNAKADNAPSYPPKPHSKKVDSEWDHIIHGAEVKSKVFSTSDEGVTKLDGNLEPFHLRSKKVDPGSLGVDKVKQYSGYLDDDEEDKHLFYWFFESRNDPKHDPVILWLNGGPGCSSLTGLFMELGPSFVNEDRKLDFNDFSWNANASVIFLDQPVNVGYSYSGDSVTNTVAAGKDVYALMTLFFEQFPEYAKQDFHIAGESYAGHYIPVFASEILSHKSRNINLKSVMIGNGLTDGLTQYQYYKPMACGDGGYPAVLDESACQSLDNAYPRCASLIQSCYDSESAWTCVPASIYCNNAMIGPYQRTGMNPYDVRIPCENGNLCYWELDWITDYLNDDKVMKALGAEVSSYDSCNFDINRNFLMSGDWMKPFHRLVPGLLEQIPVLVYAGDADFICNWLGNLAWTEALEWPGQEKYKDAKLKDLKLKSDDSTKTGRVKSSGNFTFVQLYKGGHMIPYDQPEASLDMAVRWITGEWLDTE